MPLHDLLRDGTLGARFAPPSTWRLVQDTPGHVHFADPEHAIEWHMLYASGLHFDPGAPHASTLPRDVAGHVRVLFEQVHRQMNANAPDAPPPRTSREEWSPVVSVQHLELAGRPTVEILHRVAQQPGTEILMGHLLVPLEGGLLECRTVARNLEPTGLRESVLMLRRPAVNADGTPAFPTQSEVDDPALDAMFPTHPLSRLRKAHAWLRAEGLHVEPRPYRSPSRLVVVPALGVSFDLPPRFAVLDEPASTDGAPNTTFARCSFAVTDGVDSFEIREASLLRSSDWHEDAVRLTRQSYADAKATNIRVRLEPRLQGGHDSVLVHVEADGFVGRLRGVAGWIRRPDGGAIAMTIATTTALASDELAAEMAGTLDSCRWIARTAPAAPVPWWKRLFR